MLRESTLASPEAKSLESSDAVTAAEDVGGDQPVEESSGVTDAAVASRMRDRFPDGINWTNAIFLALMHVGAVAAFWHFSWQALVVAVVLYYATGMIGVTLGYHRLLTHRGLKVPAPVQYFLTMCAMASGQGSPMFWVSTHRKHHAYSDLPGDPHSPNDGFFWSHMLWLQPRYSPETYEALYKRWAPDLYKDPVHRFLDRLFPAFLWITGLSLLAIGHFWLGQGLEFLLWGLCLRIVAVYHVTWFVNSATHVWGYRNYDTPDLSRNNWWVGLLAFGEGWHNNHHAHQRNARHGHRWWEFDLTFQIIRGLKLVGLATDIVDELPKVKPAAPGSRSGHAETKATSRPESPVHAA